MTHKLFKKSLQWFGILIAAHLIVRLVYGLLFASDIAITSEYDLAAANRSLFIFCTVAQTVFSVICIKIDKMFSDYEKDFNEAMNAPSFSIIGYYKKNYLSEHLIKIAIFAVFQLPFTLFFAFWGYSYTEPFILETLYQMDAGAYVFTGSPILGFILNTVIFGVIYIATATAFLWLEKRSAERF